jgi:DNA-binding response OmpR family regulator
MMLVQMVEALGHRVVAEAASVDDGRTCAETENYDLAILDINLRGFNVKPVAQIIKRRGLPLFFLTGYGIKGVPDEFKEMPVLDKPCTSELLRSTIETILSNSTIGSVLSNRESKAPGD